LDRPFRGECQVRIREQADQWRLMGDQRPHVVRKQGNQCQRGYRTTAAGEHVDPPANFTDDRVHVTCLVLGRHLGPPVLPDGAPHPARVVGDHRAVAEESGEGDEPGAVHRLADHEKWQPPIIRRHRPAHFVGHDRVRGFHGVLDRRG